MNKNTLYVLIIVVVLLLGGLYFQTRRYQNIQKLNSEYIVNIDALTDTVRYIKDRNGDLIASISGFETELKNLKMYSQDLERQVAEYKKATKNNVTSGVLTDVQVRLPEADTIFLRDTMYVNSIYDFDFSDKYRYLTGRVQTDENTVRVSLNPEQIYASFFTGIDDKNNVFVKTDNPYIQIDTIIGFHIPAPREKKWGIGVTGGYGWNGTGFSPFIGVCVTYNILSF